MKYLQPVAYRGLFLGGGEEVGSILGTRKGKHDIRRRTRTNEGLLWKGQR